MKKSKKESRLKPIPVNNPVAKYAYRFNKAKIHIDKSKYDRNNKHRQLESFAMHFSEGIAKDFSGGIYSGHLVD